MVAIAAGLSIAATEARADVAAPSGGAANSSTGTAALKYDFTQGLDTSFDTGFKGPSAVQARAVVKIDPVKDGGPLYSVEMAKGAVVEASWSGDKKIVLKATNGSQTDGKVVVRHTLTPSIEVKVDVFGLKATFGFDATKLVNKIPGAKFAYDSRATQAFAPWGFTAVDTKLNAPDLANATLFSMPFSQFPEVVANNLEGTFGVRASTKPTFSYKTTKVMLSGSDKPIAAGAGEVVTDAIDGDFMELMASVEGEMKVAGTMAIQPFVALTKVAGYNFTTTIAIDAYSKDYTTPASQVAYQATLVHIPLPNVHVPTAGVDLGSVKAGGSAKKTVSIENSGEKAAVMTFKSSDPQFTVPGGSITIEPKGKYELQVGVSASNAGPGLAEITVSSNDPDSPEQTFKIGMNGADVGPGDENDANLPGSKAAGDDSGCGCKTAGSTTSTGGWAGIGIVALGAAVFASRRRRRAA
jgi:MYXO-CTERM domain-containing protein